MVAFFSGYGWSEGAHKSGLNMPVTARIFNTLMTKRLNYSKVMLQGGDWVCFQDLFFVKTKAFVTGCRCDKQSGSLLPAKVG